MRQKMNLPRHVIQNEDTYIIDTNKINVDVDKDDKLYLNNVINGKIISSNVYPLIYDNIEDKNNNNYYRCFDYYRKTIDDISLYNDLEDEQKLYFLTGLRDLMVSTDDFLLNKEEIKILKKVIHIVKDELIQLNVNGLDVSPFPSNRHKIIRHIKLNIDDEIIKQYFVKKYNHSVVFINIEDLSYHNFENIIDLDTYFENENINLRTKNVEKLNDGIIKMHIEDDNNILLSIDKMNLYVIPFNNNSRGGKRMIFSSKKLSNKLTKLMEQHIEDSNFRNINNIFRYNKFSPNDKKFISHYDIPYFDSKNKEISKYTLLIYLTSGHNDKNPILKIGDYEIAKIENDKKNIYTAIIFDQKYEHEGNAFIDNEKIFIRTELIFFKDKIESNDIPRKIFNVACYMSTASIFDKELKQYSNDMFNLSSKARRELNILRPNFVLLHKECEGIHYITDGEDFWFKNNLNLKIISLIVIIDYFNGKLDEKHTKISSKIIDSNTNISEYLDKISCSYAKDQIKKKYSMNKFDDISEFYESQSNESDSDSDSYDEDRICCPWHCPRLYNPRKDSYFLRYFEDFPKVKGEFDAFESSVAIFNGNIKINYDDIHIGKNKIKFTNTGVMNYINFASCWAGYSPNHYIDYETSYVDAFRLPYIPYKKYNDLYYLKIDIFNNDFIITDDTDVEIKHNPTINY
jgi:hypothetical protein